MKTHAVTGTIIALCLNICLAITPEEKESFVEFYRAKVNLAEEFPDNQKVLVIFTDLNNDGTTDALATSYGSYYETGWDWAAFTQTSQSWEPVRGVDATTKEIHSWSNIFARPGEIARVVKPQGEVEFLVLGQVFDNLASDGIGPLNKTRFWIDPDGLLQQEKINSLERYLAYRGPHKDRLIQKMQVLTVETFDVSHEE